MRVPALMIFLLCVTAAVSIPAHAQTSATAPNQKATPKAAATVVAPVKSKALLAAEKRIEELEGQLEAVKSNDEDMAKQLDASQGELKPLRQLKADIDGTAVPVSKIAATDTIGRNRAVLLVDPSGTLLWMVKKPDGEVIPVILNPNETATPKDVLVEGSGFKSLTLGDVIDEGTAPWKKVQDDYNALVDKYNNALALLKQSNDLLSQEQAVLQQVNAYNAAAQAAARQSNISNALLMLSLMQHQTYTPPPIFYRPTINCSSTALVPGTVNTTCNY